jgi:AcrR family transcriptional regulator
MERITPSDERPMPAKKPEPRSYHHGDLRKALLKAATEELAERGVEGFTLRGCARRAGVSHAAPAHHFGEVTGLLTEVATDAFERLAASMKVQIDQVARGTTEHAIAAAMGYVLFAIANPAEFALMFRVERLNQDDPQLRVAGQQAIGLAADAIGAIHGSATPMSDPVLTRRVIGLWSLAHGVASLLLSQQLGPLTSAKPSARSLTPDMVRELLGKPALNSAKDLAWIARTSASQA